MSFEEIRAEILKDYHSEINGRAVGLHPKYERYLKARLDKIPSANKRRAARYPKAYQLKSASKNNWLVVYDRDRLDYLLTFVCYFYTAKGLKAYMKLAPPENTTLIACTGHFFKRYRERLHLEHTNPMDGMIRFFTHNPIVYNKNIGEPIADGVHQVFSRYPEGLGLGFKDDNIGLVTINTFLSENELKGNQIGLDTEIREALQARYIDGLEYVDELPPEYFSTLERMLQNFRREI